MRNRRLDGLSAFLSIFTLISALIATGCGSGSNPNIKGNVSLIHQAAGEKEDISQVAKLLGNDPSLVNFKTALGDTPLHSAATWGRTNTAELLLSKGADIEAKNGGGETPLYCAAEHGQKDMVEFLITKGANMNARDDFQKTPLNVARVWGRKDVVDILVKHGATDE